MASDGKVTISTALDNSGVKKGVQSIKGSLGGLNSVVKTLGTTLAAVFSMGKLISFATDSSKAAMSLSDALTGLQSILDGQGRSFSQAQKFIEEYTSDGLIPATNAITAYKNLASRGYDDSQIRQVMTALKDASAYGRQASYTMGEAVESATEGLKNENSILVDNAGVTKNVAKMWEEYAASIGTTANNLTQQQKIQAEVTGILAESQYQTGDAAKVAGTLSGQLQQLSYNFNNLKVAVGNAINPILGAFLPIINSAVAAVVRFANAIASVVGLIFGKASTAGGALAESNDSVAASAAAGAEAEENLAKATTAAGKAAKKSLASFDELQKLQSQSGGGSASGSASGGVSGGESIGLGLDVTVDDTVPPEIQAFVDKIRALLAPLREIDFSPAVASFGRLGEAAGALGRTIGSGLEWAWFHILVPLAEWTIEEGGPAGVDLLSGALELLAAVLEPLGVGFSSLLTAAEPVFSFLGDTALTIIGSIADYFRGLAGVFAEKSPEIAGILKNLGDAFGAFWAVLEPILGDMVRQGKADFDRFAKLAEDFTGFVIDALYGLSEFLAGVFTGDWERAWGGIKGIFDDTKTFLVGLLDDLLEEFGLSFDDIAVAASNTWAGIKETVVSVWDGITSTVKDSVNGLISIINSMISGIISGINGMIGVINSFGFDLPDWDIFGQHAGKHLGISLDYLSTPQIPYLAKGAVLPANKPFMAMVGDQKHGTNVEAPLSTIQEAVALVMEDYAASNLAGQEAIVAVLREILEAVLGIEIDGEILARAVENYRRKMAVVKGGT